MKQHRRVTDMSPVKAEVFSSCVKITSYLAWRQMLKKLKIQLKGIGIVKHRGYMYKSRKSWEKRTGCCYIPEYSDTEYSRMDIENICRTECKKKGVKYSSMYAAKLFTALSWAEPEEVVKIII